MSWACDEVFDGTAQGAGQKSERFGGGGGDSVFEMGDGGLGESGAGGELGLGEFGSYPLAVDPIRVVRQVASAPYAGGCRLVLSEEILHRDSQCLCDCDQDVRLWDGATGLGADDLEAGHGGALLDAQAGQCGLRETTFFTPQPELTGFERDVPESVRRH